LIGFIAFSVSGRNREMAIPLSAGKKPKKPIVLFPNDHVASSLCLYCQKNSLEEGLCAFAFLQERQKILRIL